MVVTARPWMITWAPVSLLGLSSTGFMSVCRRQISGLGLHRLGATDLAAFGRHGTVERHVLRL